MVVAAIMMVVITDEAQFYTTQHNTQVIEYASECVCVFPFCCEVGMEFLIHAGRSRRWRRGGGW